MKIIEQFKQDAEKAMMRATEDATQYGSGFIRILRDGTVERLPPARVLYMPDDPEIPD